MNQATVEKTVSIRPGHKDPALEEVRELMSACMQCGTCTASCPSFESMDLTPRQVWRLVQLGLENVVFASKTFWLCSSCYSCQLRCPRGMPTTRAMAALKRAGATMDHGRKNAAFYRTFMNNVRRYSRIQELALMNSYFMNMRDPLLPLHFAGLSMKLMRRGKIRPPSGGMKGRLEPIFKKVEEMEGRS
jgi:heterodisulfide reductase subunit C